MAWQVSQGQDILFPKRANDRPVFYLYDVAYILSHKTNKRFFEEIRISVM